MVAFAQDEMLSIVDRVFNKQESTIEDEASDKSIEELKQTVQVVRRTLRNAIAGLPEQAFEKQPDDVDGNDVWSAGEIASHIAGAMMWTDANLSKVLGNNDTLANDDIKQFADVRIRSKDESLEAMTVADRELDRILDGIPADAAELPPIEHEDFGVIGARGWLLLTALHEADHANQLRELGLAIRNG